MKREMKYEKMKMPTVIKTKDGELTPEMERYIRDWVKENSDEINKNIFRKIPGVTK